MSHIRHYRVLPWATGTLTSLESVAKVPDRKVATKEYSFQSRPIASYVPTFPRSHIPTFPHSHSTAFCGHPFFTANRKNWQCSFLHYGHCSYMHDIVPVVSHIRFGRISQSTSFHVFSSMHARNVIYMYKYNITEQKNTRPCTSTMVQGMVEWLYYLNTTFRILLKYCFMILPPRCTVWYALSVHRSQITMTLVEFSMWGNVLVFGITKRHV